MVCEIKKVKIEVQFVDYGNKQLCESADLFVFLEQFTHIVIADRGPMMIMPNFV